MAQPTQEKLLENITIPTLDEITQKVLDLINCPEASARDYSQVIINDPGLSTTVLKLVNSALYALPNRIASIQDACVLLGLRNLSSLCLSAAIAKEMTGGKSQAISDCWQHCLSTGHVARGLANTICPDSAGHVSTAGLLHGVGVIGLMDTDSIDFEAITNVANWKKQNWVAAQEEALGFDHAAIGAGILRKWRMSPEVCEIVAGCEALEAVQAQETFCVALASLAVQKERGHYKTRANPEADFESMASRFPQEWEAVSELIPQFILEADLQIDLMRT